MRKWIFSSVDGRPLCQQGDNPNGLPPDPGHAGGGGTIDGGTIDMRATPEGKVPL